MIINTDSDAKMIIEKRIKEQDVSYREMEILKFVRKLMNTYSFVENQTYPRPSHPNPNKRKDPYFTMVAIIISLRTTLENETKAMENFCNKYSSLNDVLKSDIDELANTIKCSGMSEKRAKIIYNISEIIRDKYNGKIENILCDDINKTKEKLLQLPGLGQKSTDCMLELAFDLPTIVVDINVFRVISRLYFSEKGMSFNNNEDVLIIKKFLENNIKANYIIYQIIHTILLLHGKYICKSKPKCEECLFKGICIFYKDKNEYEQLKLMV